jgi:hypothetical protein
MSVKTAAAQLATKGISVLRGWQSILAAGTITFEFVPSVKTPYNIPEITNPSRCRH